MIIIYHLSFRKDLKKLTREIQNSFKERVEVFISNPFDPILNNHKLSGENKGLRSINMTGDIRALYYIIENDRIMFIRIGSHSNL